MAASLRRHSEPRYQVLYHFAKEQVLDALTSGLVRGLEAQLAMAVYRRLPEELDEAGKVKSIVAVRFE